MTQTSIFNSRGKKALLLAIGFLAVVVIIGSFGVYLLNKNPVVHVPMPVMPSPNAFDFFTKAGNAVKDSSKIGYAISRSYVPSDTDPDNHSYSQADKELLVRENAETLQTLRSGFAYSYRNPPARSFDALFPYYAKERGMARLLALESQVKAGRGDWSGAIGSNLDAVQVGVMVPRGGTVIGSLVGIACESIGRRPIWRTYAHLNAAQSRTAAQRIGRLAALHMSFAETMQEEKWSTQASLLETFHRPDWIHQMAVVISEISGNDVPIRAIEAHLLTTSKRQILDTYTRYIDQAIAVSQRPYAVGPKWPAVPDDAVSQALLPEFNLGRLKYTDNAAQDALLMTTLALRAYKLAHGAYPTTLGLLVPGYLKAVPDDPFAISEPLHYRSVGKNYVLYSIGPDGKDNGGKPIFDPSRTQSSSSSSDPRYFVMLDSKGDIVAGINIY